MSSLLLERATDCTPLQVDGLSPFEADLLVAGPSRFDYEHPGPDPRVIADDVNLGTKQELEARAVEVPGQIGIFTLAASEVTVSRAA